MKADKNKFRDAQRYYADSEKLHSAGVMEFKGLWLGANENTVDIARSWGFDPSDPGAKQFLSLLTLRIMRATSPTTKRSGIVNAICGREDS